MKKKFIESLVCGIMSLVFLLVASTAVAQSNRIRWRFQMESRFGGAFVAVAPNGTVYASDLSKLYALTPDGDLLWAVSGAGGRRPISVGADGTIYTAGNLIKAINPDGTLKWQFPNPFPGSSLVAGPNVGPDGNVYVAQDTFHGGGLGPFSLDPDGNLRWSDPDNGLIGSFPGSNSAIVFGEDRLYVGNVTEGNTPPILTAFDFDGDQLWSSIPSDRGLHTGTFPKMDPFGRVIVGWGQTAIQAITPDGQVDWRTFHPDGINLPLLPGIDSNGVIYTGPYSFLELWAINPDGNTGWAIPGSSGLLDALNVPPDGSIILAGGSDGFGQPGWARAYDTADGALLWQVDLLAEGGINQYVCSQQPTFTPDSQTAYFATCFLSDVGHSYVYAINTSNEVVPDSYLVTRGNYISGGVVELTESDNADLSIQRAVADTQSRIEFEVKAVSPVAGPSSLEVTLEGGVFSRSQVNQTIELLNYDAGSWEQVDTRVASRFADVTVTVATTGDLTRFVESGTMCIEARIRYQSTNPRQRFASNTDQFLWIIGR